MQMPEEIICTKCNIRKNIKLFPPHNKKFNGVDSWCRDCRKNYRNQLRSTLDGFLYELGRWRKNARYQRKMDIKFDLTFEQKKEMWENQKGLCALTGLPMTHVRGKGFVETNASIDRIDSNIGYELNNLQLVMWCVNRAKGSMSVKDFVEMCKIIVEYNRSIS